MVQNTYVKVIGAVRSSRESRTLMVYSLKPITDMEEVTAHLLEVVVTPLRIMKMQRMMSVMLRHDMMGPSVTPRFGSATPAVVSGRSQHQLMSQQLMRSTPRRETQFSAPRSQFSHSLPFSAAGDSTVFSNSQYSQSVSQSGVPGVDTVYRLVRSSRAVEGVGREQLYSTCGLDRTVVDSAIDHLAADGYIYSTIDEDHFKSVDA